MPSIVLTLIALVVTEHPIAPPHLVESFIEASAVAALGEPVHVKDGAVFKVVVHLERSDGFNCTKPSAGAVSDGDAFVGSWPGSRAVIGDTSELPRW